MYKLLFFLLQFPELYINQNQILQSTTQDQTRTIHSLYKVKKYIFCYKKLCQTKYCKAESFLWRHQNTERQLKIA